MNNITNTIKALEELLNCVESVQSYEDSFEVELNRISEEFNTLGLTEGEEVELFFDLFEEVEMEINKIK